MSKGDKLITTCECGKDAVYLRVTENKRYCKQCFENMFLKRILLTIQDYKMIHKNERILLALSGGKDSTTLLYCLKKKLKPELPNFYLETITVDEGITSYRPNGINIAKINCKNLGINHKIVKFKDVINCDLDNIKKKYDVRNKKFSACSFCGPLRRYILNKYAVENNFDKIAFAHNLDDEAQTILMNLLDSSVDKFLLYSTPMQRAVNGNGNIVPRIKPLFYSLEKEIKLYSIINNLRTHDEECPYTSSGMRDDIIKIINSLESKYPGVKYKIVKFREKSGKYLNRNLLKKYNYCKKCGEITSQAICKVCQIYEEISKNS